MSEPHAKLDRLKIFADGAALAPMLELARDPRIADTGRDPVPLMREALSICRAVDRRTELLWASPRELLNIVQAAEIGCDIITVTNDLLAKLPTLGKDLGQFSLETVQMFHRDAEACGFKL